MLLPKREHPKQKQGLHLRNKHRERYDFETLVKSCPELAPFVRPNPYQDDSIDFFDPLAVKMLNKALLKHFYGIDYWDIPQGALCPPIPGRADYLHYLADLLASDKGGTIPVGPQVRCLDVGTGANCIYPILGNRSYGWSFTATDIAPAAVENARIIVAKNPCLEGFIEIRLQRNRAEIFENILESGEYYDVTICNPPFHSSQEAALLGSQRKVTNLKGAKQKELHLNFGGNGHELWCPGGEVQFVCRMAEESRKFSSSCGWFTSLVSQGTHLPGILHLLKKLGAIEIKTIDMSQGNKISRIVAWHF